jgi:hypothetical protein
MRKIHVKNVQSSDIFKVLMYVKMYKNNRYNTNRGARSLLEMQLVSFSVSLHIRGVDVTFKK